MISVVSGVKIAKNDSGGYIITLTKSRKCDTIRIRSLRKGEQMGKKKYILADFLHLMSAVLVSLSFMAGLIAVYAVGFGRPQVLGLSAITALGLLVAGVVCRKIAECLDCRNHRGNHVSSESVEHLYRQYRKNR